MTATDRTTIEFYASPKAASPFASVASAAIPSVGDAINIDGVTYVVTFRSFTLDHPTGGPKTMRCNCNLKKMRVSA